MGFLKRAAVLNDRVDRHDHIFHAERYVESPSSCFFYHTMDLPTFGVQDGGWDLRGRFLDYIGHVELKGKRVLDVGSASGFLSFEAERYGASEVVSFDLDSAERQHLLPFAGSPYVTDHEAWSRRQSEIFTTWQNGYWLAHRLLRSKAKAVYGDIYHPASDMGRFDVVIVGAVLEHLIDPLSALFALSRHAADTIVINTDYIDSEEHVARFNGRAHIPHHTFTFWTYSLPLYDEYMKIMGFELVRHHKDVFAGVRPSPGAPRPMLPRAALVYQRTA